MNRKARFRAFKCRMGVHRWAAALRTIIYPKQTMYCLDCRAIRGDR